MADFFLRPKARQDLEDIWLYTYETWGEEQAGSYIYDLDNGFRAIADNPEKGRSCDDIREGYRKYFVRKHIIFYRLGKKGIEIVRILHQRMDTEWHLK
jgi:toxin ParE1/3/4